MSCYLASALALAWPALTWSDSPSEQLRDALAKHAIRVVDLFREWDVDESGNVSKSEFRLAMPMLGLDVPVKHIDRLFDTWDPDHSGAIPGLLSRLAC